MVTEYVNRVGQNLVRNSDAQVPFTIKVIDSDEINAFALPGGFFYVNSGLILAADEEAELAGVMAHEIAHVAACHAARENTRGNLMQMASIPLIFVGGAIGYAALPGGGFGPADGFPALLARLRGRGRLPGSAVYVQVGIRPSGLLSFFEKVQAQEKKKPGSWPRHFRLILRPPTGSRNRRRRSNISCRRARSTWFRPRSLTT